MKVSLPTKRQALGWFLALLGVVLLPHLVVVQLGLGGYFIYRGHLLIFKEPLFRVRSMSKEEARDHGVS